MRIIDADALLQRAVPHGWSTPLWVSDIVIEDAPTIEAEPIRHGKWIKQDEDDGSNIYGWECSVCGEGVAWQTDEDINIEKYCYHCGCKMDLKEVEE